MSIKSVNCPRCNTSINVPASMASTRCASCGNVFPISAAGAPQANAAPNQSSKVIDPDDKDSTSEERVGQWLVVGGVAGLAIVGLILLTIVQSMPASEKPEKPEVPMRTQATVVEDLNLNPTDAEPAYRVVELPESTRQRIYRDYAQMIASSFGKSKKVPKSGAAGQALNKTLGAVADREVTHMALINGVTEADIAQIYAEGQAKGWK